MAGETTNCTNTNDSEILKNQCATLYSANNCSSMSNYLSVMANECYVMKNAGKNTGVDCGKIFAGNYYGNEASKYAEYVEKNGSGTARYDEVANSVGAGSSAGYSFDEDLDQISNKFGLPDHPGGVGGVLETVLVWLINIIGVVAIIAFMISGLQYFMAAGNEKMIEIAKRNMVYSILGIVAALSGVVILQAVSKLMSGSTFF